MRRPLLVHLAHVLFVYYLGIPSIGLPGTVVVVMAQDHYQSQSSAAFKSGQRLLQVDDLKEETFYEMIESLTPTLIMDETASPTDPYNSSSFPTPSPTSELEEIEELSSSPTIAAHNAPDTLPPTFFPTGLEQPTEEQQEDDANEGSQSTINSAAIGNGIVGQFHGHGWYPRIQLVVVSTLLFLVGLPALFLL